ncbi:MAG TPA: ricin-type beta-trefoil lectin domain protein [Streptosporangiaceae bacterium]
MAFSARAAARYAFAAAAAIVLPASIVAAASISRQADHSASRYAVQVTSGPAAGASGSVPQPGPVMRPASVAPRGAFDRILSAQQAASAAQACAGYATYAGWTNNASNGDLVTASAICVAESGGRPTVYYCNPTGQDGYYPPVNCSGMYDRGLWQIDNQAWTSITDTCAFAAKCNADGAYAISQRGVSFSPWATYTSHVYANYLTAAQSAVRALRGGTVPSGVAGVCLSRAAYTQNAAAITSTCGSGAGRQQWRMARSAIRDGDYCLAVASPAKTAAVRLRRCNASSYQQWTALGNGLLRNALSGRCLRDPNSTVTPGTPVNVGSCILTASRLWWLP